MGDWKMECAGCGSWTNGVGLAMRDGLPCPYCGLPAEVQRAVAKARERNADERLIQGRIDAEKRALKAESEAAAGWALARSLQYALAEYTSKVSEAAS